VIIPRPGRTFPVSASFPRISRALFTGLLLCACLGWSADKKPEKPYALIYGTVWGPDDRPVYGVTVRLRRDGDKKPKWEQYSNHQGEFAFRVPAGKAIYYLAPDPKTLKLSDGNRLQPGDPVKVEVENDERVDTGLHLKK